MSRNRKLQMYSPSEKLVVVELLVIEQEPHSVRGHADELLQLRTDLRNEVVCKLSAAQPTARSLPSHTSRAWVFEALFLKRCLTDTRPHRGESHLVGTNSPKIRNFDACERSRLFSLCHEFSKQFTTKRTHGP